MRTLPATSLVGSRLVPAADQTTVAVVAALFWSTSASGEVRLAPVALFQLRIGTTPALSVAAIAVPAPTKSMPIVGPDPGGFTANPTLAECTSAALVPVTASVELPVGVVEAVDTVSVDVAP